MECQIGGDQDPLVRASPLRHLYPLEVFAVHLTGKSRLFAVQTSDPSWKTSLKARLADHLDIRSSLPPRVINPRTKNKEPNTRSPTISASMPHFGHDTTGDEIVKAIGDHAKGKTSQSVHVLPRRVH